jgi:predicted N-acetyltransferase YhbS
MIETVPTVRAAVSKDAPAIARLVERALAEYQDADPLMHEGYLAYSLDATHAIGAEQLVAEIDGRIVGSVLFFPRVMYRAAWPADVATFGTLAVDPTIRRSGIGGRLVEACIERAKAEGATGLMIETMPFMASAEAFYGRFGFKRWPAGDWDGTFVVREFLGGRPAPETILSAWRLDFG